MARAWAGDAVAWEASAGEEDLEEDDEGVGQSSEAEEEDDDDDEPGPDGSDDAADN